MAAPVFIIALAVRATRINRSWCSRLPICVHHPPRSALSCTVYARTRFVYQARSPRSARQSQTAPRASKPILRLSRLRTTENAYTTGPGGRGLLCCRFLPWARRAWGDTRRRSLTLKAKGHIFHRRFGEAAREKRVPGAGSRVLQQRGALDGDKLDDFGARLALAMHRMR